MKLRGAAVLTAGALCCAAAAPAGAQISPHLALYSMNLGSSRVNSGVVEAHGTMAYKWGETCGGWTIEQRYRLRLNYAESEPVDIESSFVTWESKDGRRYRFNQRELRNGKLAQEVRGSARLDGPGKGGVATFEKPKPETITLAPGVLFPSAHTILLLKEAEEGRHFVTRQIFDGATEENAAQVSAVIGDKVAPPAGDRGKPLLDHAGWRMRLAFFPTDPSAEQPEYELGMELLQDGVSRDMVIDYGDYTIRAKLDDIEPLARPRC